MCKILISKAMSSPITRVDLNESLTEFPQELYDHVDTLEILNLTGNRLGALPKDLSRFKKLRILFASNNPMSCFPEGLEACESLEMIGFRGCGMSRLEKGQLPPRLRWLILTDNALTQLPEDLGDSRRLQKLMLSGNQLSCLPESLQSLQHLEMLRTASNAFAEAPAWWFELPELRWLAFSGNPLLQAPHKPSLPTWQWSQLGVGDLLGKGASGEVFRASHPSCEALALKVFSSPRTSDGTPSSEIAAWEHAPNHPSLLPTLGEVFEHPEGKKVMLMPQLAEGTRSVAEPPSLSSCSRDVYTKSFALSAELCRQWLIQMAEVGALLHERGLMHGDFYAHNLHFHPDEPFRLKLGDFGGATYYRGVGSAEKLAEKVEVQAFGTLAEELLVCVPVQERHTLSDMVGMVSKLTVAPVAERPHFREILSQLR